MKDRIRLVILSALALLFISRAYQNQALSLHFVDEEDNLVLGKYLLKGEKLYGDLFSQHQPLAYIFSAGVQKTTNPNTLFLLIKRHREAIILWSAVWSLILVARFGLPLFLSVLIIEPVKFYLLGHLFLSESLVFYPLLYLLSWTFLVEEKPVFFESLFLGVCFGLSLFLLSPLWPALGLLGVVFIWLGKNDYRKLLPAFLGVLGVVILAWQFVIWPDYFHNAFEINFRYYIPLTSPGSGIASLSQALLAPVLSLGILDGGVSLQIIRLMSALFLFGGFFLLRSGQFKKFALMALTLGLINIRFVMPGREGFSGFHILPWFAAMVTVASIAGVSVLQKSSGLWPRLPVSAIFFLAIAISFKIAGADLFPARDQGRDFYVNYSRQADLGEAVKIMKGPGEKLMVVPDDWLIYWQADIPHASRMVNYYAWMAKVPEIKDSLDYLFDKNPPTFFYCDCKFGYFGLEKYFDKYRVMEKDGEKTKLMILSAKADVLGGEQKNRLHYYNFAIK